MVNSQQQRPPGKPDDLIFRLRDTTRTEYLSKSTTHRWSPFLICHPVDYATDLTVAVVERCTESSSPSDTKPEISREERDALKHLIQNIGRIYPPRRFVALLVATLIYIERIEGRTNMKQGMNITCSVFVGGVILASRVGLDYLFVRHRLIQSPQTMQDQKLSYEAWGQCTNIRSRGTLIKAERAMRSILNKSFSLPDSRVQHHLNVVDSMYMDKTIVIGPSSMARTSSDQSDLSAC